MNMTGVSVTGGDVALVVAIVSLIVTLAGIVAAFIVVRELSKRNKSRLDVVEPLVTQLTMANAARIEEMHNLRRDVDHIIRKQDGQDAHLLEIKTALARIEARLEKTAPVRTYGTRASDRDDTIYNRSGE